MTFAAILFSISFDRVGYNANIYKPRHPCFQVHSGHVHFFLSLLLLLENVLQNINISTYQQDLNKVLTLNFFMGESHMASITFLISLSGIGQDHCRPCCLCQAYNPEVDFLMSIFEI
jgi:hypothetical protein